MREFQRERAKGIPDGELRELESAIENLMRLKSTRVGSRCSPEALQGILENGRMKSQFETGTSGGALNTKRRADLEYTIMGYDKNMWTEERPIYGMFFDASDLEDFRPYLIWEGCYYGSVTIIFKDEIKRYTTFTAGDTLDAACSEIFFPTKVLAPSKDSLPVSIWSEVVSVLILVYHHVGVAL